MNSRQLIQDSLRTGVIASVGTTLAVAACGRRELGDRYAPINAVSHIAWKDKAARQNGPSWKYTFSGVVLNTGAMLSWAVMYEFLFGRASGRNHVAKALVGGPIVSSLAYLTDYHVVPARLTPGFEKRLSNRSLLGVYTVLAVALAVGGLAKK